MRTAIAVAMIAIATACSPEQSDRAIKATQSVSNAIAAPHYSSATALTHAESLYFAAEYDSAATIWHKALTTDSVKRDSATQAHIMMWLGMREWRLGNYDSARAIGERSLTLKLRLGRTRELSRSFNSLGLIARDEGRLADARDLFGKAIETARASNDTAGINRGAINLALVQQDLGEFNEAQKGFETARDAGRTLGDARLEGNALNNLGALLIKIGDPAGAVPVLHQAVAAYRRIDYQTGLQNSIGQLATAYDVLGDPQRAFALLDTASRMAQSQGLKQEQENNLRIFGELYQGLGDHQRALDYLSRARALSEELGLSQETGIILRAEARSHVATGRLDLARVRIEEALRIHRRGKVLFEEMTDLIALTELVPDNNRARAFIDSARLIALRINTPSARADVALADARRAVQIREWRPALATLESAERDLRNARASGTWEAAALRARAYAGLGLLDSAVISGRSAVAAAERVRSRISTGSLRTSFTSERSAIYADLVIALLRSKKETEAFEVADAARGRELLEHLAEVRRDIGKRGATDITEGERLLRQIDELTRLLNEADRVPQRERAARDEERTNALAERLTRLEAEYEALATRTTRDDRAQSRILGTGRAQLTQVAQSLAATEAIVEYMVTPDRVLAFVVRRDGLTELAIEVADRELAGRVRVARGLAAKRTSLDARDDAVFRALHSLLVAPVEKSGALRGIKRIIVIPHSTLVYLPFAALVDESGKYLSDRYAILHAPSAGALVSLRSRQKDRASSTRAVVLAPFPATLPSTVQEARDVRKSITSSRVLIGARASERALREALAEATFVHVASHGSLNRRNPLFSRIELAKPPLVNNTSSSDDGRLDLHEVFGITIGSQLVFLSGCETGLGTAWSTDFVRGEDFATLAQAFLYSGAREVIATLWRLDDEAAALFASRFYWNLKSLPPAEALAAAQRDVRSDSRFKGPYNWAGYTLTGSGDSITLRTPWWNPFN